MNITRVELVKNYGIFAKVIHVENRDGVGSGLIDGQGLLHHSTTLPAEGAPFVE